MIDLSSLTIPPVSVVPEPTARQIDFLASLVKRHGMGCGPWSYDLFCCAIGLARRCRELESEVERLHDHINKGMKRR